MEHKKTNNKHTLSLYIFLSLPLSLSLQLPGQNVSQTHSKAPLITLRNERGSLKREAAASQAGGIYRMMEDEKRTKNLYTSGIYTRVIALWDWIAESTTLASARGDS